MPDNASLVKNKLAAGFFKKSFLMTKFNREELKLISQVFI
jgi:hypothetical protein